MELFYIQSLLARHMVETPYIHLRGIFGSLGRCIIQRLLRNRSNIIVSNEYHKSLTKLFSTELEFSDTEILPSSNCPISPGHRVVILSPDGQFSNDYGLDGVLSIADIEVILVTPNLDSIQFDLGKFDSHFIIHHMIPSDSSPHWNNQLLDGMIDSLLDGNDFHSDGHVGWWVAEQDVADAICRMIVSEHTCPKTVNVTGRRSWKAEQVFEELEMLYNRTMAGQSGSFTSEHLSTPRTPNIEVVAVEQSIQYKRPDLKNLHDSLVLADGEGWRPMTPIRAGLMHFLIGKMN